MLVTPLHHFFRTTSQTCPYLPGRTERKVLTELGTSDPVELYNSLSRAGFRRSRRFAYRPACSNCSACQPVRIVVDDFASSRWSRRIAHLNSAVAVAVEPPRVTPEQYRLFSRYLAARHVESDMAEMSYADYRTMVEDTPIDTKLLTLRDARGRLIGACLTDELDDGLSAVYSFYDPGLPKQGLGTFLILSMIAYAKRADLPYVYLGYWIAESRKMAYKTRFRPLEWLGPNGWQLLDAEEWAQAAAD
jgi:arginine-tRNA-protein transferase